MRLQFAFAPLLALLTTGCVHTPKMLVYNKSHVESYLRQFGYPEDGIANYWQDSEGQAIYVPAGDLLHGYEIFLLTAGSDKPMRISLPAETKAKTYWINSQGKIRYLPSYAYPEEDSTIGTVVDNQSGFFFQTTRDRIVHVGHMEQNKGWLFSSIQQSDKFLVNQICARNDVVYLLDHQDHASPAFMHSKINCWAFSPDPANPTRYIKVDEFSVPGMVKIVDPFSPRFLCQGYGYLPFPSHRFLYNTQSHKVMGGISDDSITVFLDGNWLASRLTR